MADTKNLSPNGNAEHLLVVNHLKKYFPIKKALHEKDSVYLKAVDDVSLTLDAGKTVGIVGESGCGKSTLGRTILRLYEPTAGEIIFDGDHIENLKGEALRRKRPEFQMIFQDPYSSLSPRMTVGEIVSEAVRQHKIVPKTELRGYVLDMMEKCGLQAHHYDRYPHEFSGGQRQRICIVKALALKPKLVICDEPTTALDVTVQKQVIKLLNDLQAKLGFAMIFVSHDLALVAEVAHNITVMYAGQVIEQAPTKELLTNPIHEYTRGLLGSVLSIESGSGRLHQVPGAVPSPRDFPKGDRFAPRSSHPRIGLDTRPVFKRVPGTEHFYSELPDEVLKANGLTPHAEVM